MGLVSGGQADWPWILFRATHLAKAISSSGPVHGGKFISEGKVPETISATGSREGDVLLRRNQMLTFLRPLQNITGLRFTSTRSEYPKTNLCESIILYSNRFLRQINLIANQPIIHSKHGQNHIHRCGIKYPDAQDSPLFFRRTGHLVPPTSGISAGLRLLARWFVAFRAPSPSLQLSFDMVFQLISWNRLEDAMIPQKKGLPFLPATYRTKVNYSYPGCAWVQARFIRALAIGAWLATRGSQDLE